MLHLVAYLYVATLNNKYSFGMVSFYALSVQLLSLTSQPYFSLFPVRGAFFPSLSLPLPEMKKSMLTVSVLVSCHVIKNQEIVFTKGSKSRMESDCLKSDSSNAVLSSRVVVTLERTVLRLSSNIKKVKM